MNRYLVVLGAALTVLALPHTAGATSIGPTPYASFTDSPFNGETFSWFYLEDFEDGLLNTPGVSSGPATAVVAVGGYTDSVDGDDGVIDGSGSGGHSLWSNFAASVFNFTFDANTLGALPTHVGLVWTDIGQPVRGPYGMGNVTFEAFDQNNLSLGAYGPFLLGDGSISGETAEDRFFGATNAGGILRIEIRAPGTKDWEIDHLQYGLNPSLAVTSAPAATQPVPEPATCGLLLTGVGMLVARKRRRASK